MVYDCFTFNGEMDMLEIRFNLLSRHADRFVIVESTKTFSGNAKPLFWQQRGDRFKQWEDKVIYAAIGEYIDPEIIKQVEERNYVDTDAFKRAFYQKECIRKALEYQCPDDEDVVYYGDVDEVWKPQKVGDKVHKLRQIAYSYYLNNRSPEDWRGTIVTKWKNLKDGCLNDMRANPIETDILQDGGWHWTNLGGLESIQHKIESYDHTEVNIPQIKDGLEERLRNNEDFLGRGFKFWVSEDNLPKCILDNKELWKQKGLWK